MRGWFILPDVTGEKRALAGGAVFVVHPKIIYSFVLLPSMTMMSVAIGPRKRLPKNQPRPLRFFA